MKKFDKNCVFCKIAAHEIEKDFVLEDGDVMVFPDLNPNAPVHLLVVPKRHIKDFLELDDPKLENKLIDTIQKVTKASELKRKGVRVSMNGGGAQLIDHLHIHITGPIERTESI